MKFAKKVFAVAGVYGLLTLAPLYFLEGRIGYEDPPAVTHPEYFYGFVGIALAWQLLFFVIASDPARFRPAMPIAFLEKLAYGAATMALCAVGRAGMPVLVFGLVDLILGALFLAAFAATRTVSAATPGYTRQETIMSTIPKSLLQIAGAPLAPGPLDSAAVLLIDPQLEYLSGAIPLADIDAAVEEAERLLAVARENDVPVFHIVHHGKPGAPAFDPDGPYAASIPALAPRDAETVVIKSLPNAFAKTDLHALIRQTGRNELIIAGFATHMCVSATTRAALDLGYRCTVVAQATATRDLPHPLGQGVTPAHIVHEGTLAALADRFAVVVPNTAALAAGGG